MKQLIERKAAELVEVDGRELSTRVGTYSNDVTVAFVKKHRDKVITSRDVTRMQYGRLTRQNEDYVRRKFSLAVNTLQAQNILAYLLYETEGRHKVVGVKIWVGDERDKIDFPIYLERARARKEISEERYNVLTRLNKTPPAEDL